MMWVISLKEAVYRFYRTNDIWILPLFKGLLAFTVFFAANTVYDFGGKLNNIPLMMLAGVLCAFLPWSAVSFFSMAFIISGIQSRGDIPLFLISLGIFLIIALIQVACRAGNAILIALMPLAFILKIEFFLPVFAGLSLGFLAIVPIAMGTLTYYYLEYMSVNIDKLSQPDDIMERVGEYTGFIEGFFEDKSMFLMLMIMIVIVLVVYVFRNMSFDYAWHVAAVSGLFAAALLLILGNSVEGVELDLGGHFVSIAFSLVLSLFYVIVFYAADYQGTKRVRFEDDDYFYYLKAVPKIKVDLDDEDEDEGEEETEGEE